MSLNDIKFNQTLHGYDDGHTLISSSTELPAEVRRMMLLLSDMSGSRMEQGFEEYLTGYPIKELNMYAVAKTWYAPEMKRPGCVWTHTLLIDFQDIPKILNFNSLLRYFVRPSDKKPKAETYSSRISFHDNLDSDRNFQDSLPPFIEGEVARIVKRLYGNDENAVLVMGMKQDMFSKLALMIWKQQWPRLKRNFSFCTGAISPRKLKGELFDFQLTPHRSVTSIPSDYNANFIDLEESSWEIFDEWVSFAINDLFFPLPKTHNFLNYFGSDLDIKRTSFKTLIETYLFFLKEKPVLEDSLEFLQLRYPSNKEANNLKSSILTDVKNPFMDFLPKYSEGSILLQLTITTSFSSFDYEKLSYKDRFLSYFEDLNPTKIKILKNIIRLGPNIFGEESITDLAGLLGKNTYLDSIWSDKQLTSVFVGLNPKLTFNKNFWLSNEKNQIELINQLKRSQIGVKGWHEISSILVETNSSIEPAIIQYDGVDLVKVILDTINDQRPVSIGKNWIDYLKSKPSHVLDWFDDKKSPTNEVIKIIVSVLDPNDSIVFGRGLDTWIQFWENVETSKRHTISIEIHAFGIALALNSKGAKAQKIFESSFEMIYFALASESLDYNLWKNLEIHTKSLSFWKDWDKCKKIINSIVDFYISNNLDIKKLASGMHNHELMERLLKQYKKRA